MAVDRSPSVRGLQEKSVIQDQSTLFATASSSTLPRMGNKKRKLETSSRGSPKTPAVIDLTGDSECDEYTGHQSTRPVKCYRPSAAAAPSPPSSTRTRTTKTPTIETIPRSKQVQQKLSHPSVRTCLPSEKRLKRFRPHSPRTFSAIHSRALTQRMYVLSRHRDLGDPFDPRETLTLAGTTGNIYTVTIATLPSCDCPHALKGNQCKHVVYVLARVLRAQPEFQYQAALLPSELREIFARAPPLPAEAAAADGDRGDGLRKAIEGECPICCEDFGERDGSEGIVYCKASCGNNVHKDCFERWAATKQREAEVTCPFCRAPWQGEERPLSDLARKGRVGAEGYVNVAHELGIPATRDYSSYNDFFMNRHFGWDR